MKRLRIPTLSFLCVILLASPDAFGRELDFEERVALQQRIQAVYYRHQKDATRPFAEAVPRAVLERKVLDYLKQSALLEHYWHTEITSEMLSRELGRIAADTRMPDRLRELYAALDDDPFLVEECLARPILVSRLVQQFYAYDERIHASQRLAADELREKLLGGAIDPTLAHPQRDVVTVDPAAFERLAATGVGTIGAVEERREAFVLRVVLYANPTEMRVASYVFRKRPWDHWWRGKRTALDARTVAAVSRGGLRLPVPGGSRKRDCLPEHTWDNASLDDLPDARAYHSVVWTGNVMIAWGGFSGWLKLNTGGRYDPTTDSWSDIANLNAPAPRFEHTAVWTGKEMIVWGGYYNLGPTGGRYDPVADSWSATSTVGAPSQRWSHTAVWTGNRMLVWGGYCDGGTCGDGASYNPDTDSWQPLPTTNSPGQRTRHSAVWSDHGMIVWGGRRGSEYLNTGAIYRPGTNRWTRMATAAAPLARSGHIAVWTGNRLVVWGGSNDTQGVLSSGGVYNPSDDAWLPTSSGGAPSARTGFAGVWADNQLLVWGGGECDGGVEYDSGGSYNPQSDSWQPMATTNAPSPRCHHSAIWSGERMIVWGGVAFTTAKDTGGRYDPVSDSWTPTNTGTAPERCSQHTAVWTGNRMIVWGGGTDAGATNLGAAYDPTTDSWQPTSTLAAPEGRRLHTAVWTGNEMVVWGGETCSGSGPYFSGGGRYDPLTDSWTPTSMNSAPVGRAGHTAVWSGDQMIVWGGYDSISGLLTSGGAYRPHTDSWFPLPTSGAPSARRAHSVVWSGEEMIVWGGGGPCQTDPATDSGASYNPRTNTWRPTSQVNSPAPRYGHSAVWTDGRMIVWGGGDYMHNYVTGSRYDPATDSWEEMSTVDAPAQSLAAATATNRGMLVWGSYQDPIGGYYRPDTDTWTLTSSVGYPSPRVDLSAVWTGGSAIFWGGLAGGLMRSGGSYVIEQEADVDTDGLTVCAGDCNDIDPTVFAFPSDIDDLVFTGKTTLEWSSDAPNSGTGTAYDVLVGTLSKLSAGGGGLDECVASDLAATTVELSEPLDPGKGSYVLVRGDNSCGPGSYGSRSDGTPRSSAICP